ncbi:MAG: methylated-DNA--[protein]-cysteine S-methyltransferase [Calditrichales bacterium]|nr:MAG: methylated-DNA--[protein]-cysteine S-methyltransferase [Calditrichales bacterium]
MDYERVEQAIRFVGDNFQIQPELEDIAQHIGMSEFHFQRLFKRWVGISPKRFLQFVTKENAKHLLQKSESLLSAAFDSGLSGPGRLHDLFVACEAVTPGEYRNRGAGLVIRYGYHLTPFGECLIALTNRGICGFYFINQGNRDHYFSVLSKTWPAAQLQEDPDDTGPVIDAIFSPGSWQQDNPFRLYVQGTNFQIKVWEALLKIPEGMVFSYEDVARQVGQPKAVRAVGSAVARNPISYLIPCHRVIRKLGEYGNYQGGPE